MTKTRAYLSTLLIPLLGQIGCASKNKSIGAGGLIGAGVGATIGAVIPERSGSDRMRNIIIGTAIGGTSGVILGAVAHSDRERNKAMQPKQTTSTGARKLPPSLKNAKVEAQWIESRVVGNRYIEGHYEYLIIEPARWDEP